MGILKSKNSISFEEALFSKVQRQILALLFIHDDQSFFTNEIIRIVGSGSGSVQRELRKLVMAEILNVNKMGNQIRYQANHASPIFSELQGIVIKTFGLADLVRNALTPITHQIRIGFIYGSIAKQQATAQSDIDLMILSDKINYADVFSLLENASIQLKRPINPTIYSPAEWSQKLKDKNNFLNRILEQAKIFLIGNENELRSISKFS